MTNRRWLILLVVVLGSLGIGLVVVGVMADKAWARMEVEASQLEKSLRAHVQQRPVLHGDAIDADATERYDKAWKRAGELLSDDDREDFEDEDFATFTLRKGRLDNAQVSILDRASPALALVREACRCSRLQPAKIVSMLEHTPAVRAMQDVLAVASWDLQRARNDRDEAGSVDHLLDAFRCASDLSRDSRMLHCVVGCSWVETIAQWSFIRDPEEEGGSRKPPLLDTRNWSKAALRRLRDGLALLDQPMPSLAYMMSHELLTFHESFKRGQALRGVPTFEWRHGFSGTLQYSRFFLQSAERIRRVDDLESSLPWSRYDAALREITERDVEDMDILEKMNTHQTRGVAEAIARAQTALRALRLVVARALGESVDLADPFGEGGNLVVTKDDDYIRIRSVGKTRDGEAQIEYYCRH